MPPAIHRFTFIDGFSFQAPQEIQDEERGEGYHEELPYHTFNEFSFE